MARTGNLVDRMIRLRPWAAVAGLAALSLSVHLVYGFAPLAVVKRARAPKFDKAVTDAFYPDAREKLGGPRPQKSTVARAAGTAGAANPPAAETAKADSGAWSSLIAAETIEDEIKSQQVKLAETLASAAKFKGGGYQRARLHLSVLATMFAIDAEYGQPMRWQREAPAMRDAAARAGFNCKVGTDASFAEAKKVSEQIQGLVRGESLDLPASEPASEWSKVADRAPLMKRLEQAQQQGLGTALANAREFSRRSELVSHDAQLIAALARVIGREGYEFADDETYRGFAQTMGREAQAVREAAAQDDYEQARRAAGEISKSCAACHEGYRS